MKANILLLSVLLTGIFISIAAVFWYQETQYLLPTPLPKNYQQVLAGQTVVIHSPSYVKTDKPVVLHFFNPDCPCSRFNIDHFQTLIKQYGRQVNFYAVLQVEKEEGAIDRFKEKYAMDIPVILDTHKQLAQACGVYSTPQAAVLDEQGKLYFRGNYNKSRYCTNPQSNYAQIAIETLLASQPSPQFSSFATNAYGCELPQSALEASIRELY